MVGKITKQETGINHLVRTCDFFRCRDKAKRQGKKVTAC